VLVVAGQVGCWRQERDAWQLDLHAVQEHGKGEGAGGLAGWAVMLSTVVTMSCVVVHFSVA
jgi:hypothetical protein